MKANKFFTSLFTLSLVIFASVSGISNTVHITTGDNLKKANNTIESAEKHDATTDLSYLRFDVNSYISENTSEELPSNTFDYLRFDVNNYLETENFENMEMPAANEFDYLRFDVKVYSPAANSTLGELPVTE